MNRRLPHAAPIVVFVANASSNELMTFALDPGDGALEPIECLELAQSVYPLAVSPDRRFLYAGMRAEESRLATFAIDAATGRLHIESITQLANPMVYLGTDQTGRYLLGASYTGNVFAILAIDATGRIRVQPVQLTPTPPRTHAILTDPANRFLFVTALGGDCILQYVFDAATGQAIANDVPVVAMPYGSGPRHLVFHPRGDVVYVNGELDGSIGVYGFDARTGRLAARQHLTIMPAGAVDAPWAADLAVTADGRFVVASERRTSTLTVFRVRDDSGQLERTANLPTEPQPRSIAVDPTGRFLIVAGETSNHLATYAVDPSSGVLTALARYPVGDKPAWISVVRLPDDPPLALEEP